MNRTTSRTVTFAHAFSLLGVEGVHAPGTYSVEVDEVLLSGLSFPVFRRVETRMILPWQSMAGGRPGPPPQHPPTEPPLPNPTLPGAG